MPRIPLLARQALAEFLGSAGLVAIVLGSGIAVQRLSPQDRGLQLLENGGLWLAEALATFGLVVLVFALVRAGRTALAPFAVGAISPQPTGGRRPPASPTR